MIIKSQFGKFLSSNTKKDEDLKVSGEHHQLIRNKESRAC